MLVVKNAGRHAKTERPQKMSERLQRRNNEVLSIVEVMGSFSSRVSRNCENNHTYDHNYVYNGCIGSHIVREDAMHYSRNAYKFHKINF